MEQGDGAHDRLHNCLQCVNLVDRAQWSQHAKRSDAGKRSAIVAHHANEARHDADEIELVPVGAQISTLVEHKAETDDAQDHLHRVDDLEGYFNFLLPVRLLLALVIGGQRDTVEANDEDDERFEEFVARYHLGCTSYVDSDFHNLATAVQAFQLV